MVWESRRAGDLVGRGCGRRPTLTRAEAQPRTLEPTQQLATLDHDGAGGDELVAVLLGDVVVIPLESSTRNADPDGEVVQFVERLIAHEVAPTATTVPPPRFVHEDRHGDETDTLGS